MCLGGVASKLVICRGINMIKNKLIYLCFLIYGICFVVLYDEYVSFVAFIILLAMPLLLFILSFLMAKRLRFFLEIDQTVVKVDDTIIITVIVENKGIFPVTYGKMFFTCGNLFGEENKVKKTMVFSVDTRERKEISFSLAGKHCGMICVTLEKVRIYDYLKIWSWKKKENKKVSVAVMPDLQEELIEIEKIRYNETGENQDSYSLYKSGDDVSQIFDIRSYRQGDKAQRIHWKLSSKKQELMIKEFSLPLGEGLEVWFDFYCPPGENKFDTMDQLFKKLFSVMCKLIKEGKEFRVIWFNTDKKEQMEYMVQGQIEEVFDLLFCTPCYGENDLLYKQYKPEYSNKKEGYYIGVGIWEDSFRNGGQQ